MEDSSREAVSRCEVQGRPVVLRDETESIRGANGTGYVLRRRMEQEQLRGKPLPPVGNGVKQRALRRRGQEPMREALYRMSGVDLTGIDAVGVETIQVLLTGYGPDLSCLPTEKHFIAHAALAPKKKKPNSAVGRVAAARCEWRHLSRRNRQTAPRACYRKMASRLGADIAVFASPESWELTFMRRILKAQSVPG